MKTRPKTLRGYEPRDGEKFRRDFEKTIIVGLLAAAILIALNILAGDVATQLLRNFLGAVFGS